MPEKKAKGKENSTSNVALEAGKFCLDLAKLIFAGVILAGLMKQDIDYVALLCSGLGVVLIFTIFGFYLIKKSKK